MDSNPVKASDLFLGFLCNCSCKLLHNCKDHFHFYSLSAVHIYDIYDIGIVLCQYC